MFGRKVIIDVYEEKKEVGVVVEGYQGVEYYFDGLDISDFVEVVVLGFVL